MKKLTLLILLSAMGLSHLSAQTSTEWKHALIEDVNAGRFTDAIAKMPYASWEFDYNVILDVDSALHFYNYCDSLDIQPTCLVDSFALLFANTYIDIGFFYQESNQPDMAVFCFDFACSVFQARIGLMFHPTYATLLNKLGLLYRDIGDYNKAEQYFLQVLNITKETWNTNPRNYVTILNNLGLLYRDIGNYVKSEQYYLETLQICQEKLGKNNQTYAVVLSNLGSLYQDKGDYSSAEEFYLEAFQVFKETLGETHPNYIVALNNLGSLYQDMGDYLKAEQYNLEALRANEEIFGNNQPNYARSLNNLGFLYHIFGDYNKAEQYYLKTLCIYKEIYGENHPDYALALNNLGSLYQDMGDYTKAEPYLLEALRTNKEILGEKHPNYARILNNLGSLYHSMYSYEKAKQYYLEALQIRKNIFGENHPDYAITLQNIGLLYCDMGDYAMAEKYLLETVVILGESLGNKHPSYAIALSNLGYLYLSKKDFARASLYVSQTEDLDRQQILNSITFMSEYERSQFLRENVVLFKKYFSIYYKADAHVSAYNLLLFTKGLQLSMTNAVKRSILESGDSALIADFEHLVTLKAYINKMETDNPTSPYLAQTREQAETLEKDLTRRSTAFRENQRQWEINWKDVQAALPKKSIAIEFADVSNDTCIALILGEKDKEPRMIVLSADDITNRTLWDKLMPEFKRVQTIYFSPDGTLHQLPLESFAYDSTSIMSDHFNMVRLSSTRELVLNKLSERRESAVLYGGILYDVSTDDLLAESWRYDESSLLAHRGIADDTTNRGSVQYLPGTRIEAETIERVLQTNHISSRLYTASAANEESFKALSGQKQNILHIGTHGFCWPDSTAQKKEFFTQRLRMIGDDQLHQQTIDPLDRCGLLFAGANIALSGHSSALPSGVQDGILTAKEISLMDLRHCDLVVLSACETARGDVTGEGVFGLQRAFKMAGVQTIVMSLWPVDDNATKLLMTEFYRNWIEKRQTKREAFTNAQNAVRYAVDEDGDFMYANPVYWAAFVMMD